MSPPESEKTIFGIIVFSYHRGGEASEQDPIRPSKLWQKKVIFNVITRIYDEGRENCLEPSIEAELREIRKNNSMEQAIFPESILLTTDGALLRYHKPIRKRDDLRGEDGSRIYRCELRD